MKDTCCMETKPSNSLIMCLKKKNQNTKCPGWNSSLQKDKQSDKHSRFTKWFYETGYYRMTVKSDIYSGQDPFMIGKISRILSAQLLLAHAVEQISFFFEKKNFQT